MDNDISLFPYIAGVYWLISYLEPFSLGDCIGFFGIQVILASSNEVASFPSCLSDLEWLLRSWELFVL